MSLHSGSFTIKNDNTLWCYGAFLGYGYDSPIKIMNDVKYFNSSNYGISVAIKTDDSLWVQGYNNYGQLGIPNETFISHHRKIMDGVKQASALEYHTMVIKKDNTLWGFGRNAHGELGHYANLKTDNANATPTKIMDDVRYVSCGLGGYTMVIKMDNSLWSFGNNRNGQLGHSTNIGSYTPNPIPQKIMDDVKYVTCSDNFTMVIKMDNTLWSFGNNQRGQLGHSSNIDTSNPNPTPRLILNNVKYVSCGGKFTMAITIDNSLYGWGLNYRGQLGFSTNFGGVRANPYPTEVMKDVRYVSCGSEHTNVIKKDGILWGFGSNSSGQLGNPRNDKGIPYPVKLFDDALFLAEQPPLQEKILLIDQDNILAFNGDKWVVASKTPYSEQDFIQYGVEYLNVYMIEALKSFSNIDIACWVQDSTNDEDLNIVLCGDYTAPYRYKIEMLEPYVLLKEWTPILTEETHSTVSLTSDMFQQATNPYTIKITVEQPDGTVITEEGNILLYDTEPKLLVKLEGKNLKIEIGDDEQDKIKFKVNLNGKQIYPSDGFTDFLPTPHVQTIYLNTKDINIDSSNTIETIAFDSYGKESKDITSFIGDYIGLIFSDEKGKYYSTDAGEVLQYLSFGSIIAGQTTLPVKVNLTNKEGMDIKNLKVELHAPTYYQTQIQISKTENPFIPEQVLTFTDIQKRDENVSFYVRIVTNADDVAHSGEFDIYAEAEPASES
ncbi:hypothetical protein EEL30_22265 [Brevibacillus laterosporus]|uniref:Uncharacterized protein n=1 Tax=Brevibacillus laterosporus TaxID=1465 RepID=A0A518VCQ1_BRELA|nr:hypothetical protein EEL30_22265 [Brevibacillus laterosporus]